MLMARREQATRIPIKTVNGQPEELDGPDGRPQPSVAGTSRMNREIHVRICERLGVQIPRGDSAAAGQPAGPTRRLSAGGLGGRPASFVRNSINDAVAVVADEERAGLVDRYSCQPRRVPPASAILHQEPGEE